MENLQLLEDKNRWGYEWPYNFYDKQKAADAIICYFRRSRDLGEKLITYEPKNFDSALRRLEIGRSRGLEDIERQRVFESRRLKMLEGFERDDIWQLKYRAVVENERVLQTRQLEHEEAFRRELRTLVKDLVYQIVGAATNKSYKTYIRFREELYHDLFCSSKRG